MSRRVSRQPRRVTEPMPRPRPFERSPRGLGRPLSYGWPESVIIISGMSRYSRKSDQDEK
jgi:hypothetical protein